MSKLDKLNEDFNGTFESCGINYVYVDKEYNRTVYEATTKAKMVSFDLLKIGTSIDNIIPFFEKKSRVERVKIYINDGYIDLNWIADRDFLL